VLRPTVGTDSIVQEVVYGEGLAGGASAWVLKKRQRGVAYVGGCGRKLNYPRRQQEVAIWSWAVCGGGSSTYRRDVVNILRQQEAKVWRR
jgi:hypothetical protein